jgi:hypothetical protein
MSDLVNYASVKLTTYNAALPPQDQKARANWFSAFGRSDTMSKDTVITGDYLAWHSAGCVIEGDGSIRLSALAMADLREAIINIGRDTGKIPESLTYDLTKKILAGTAAKILKLLEEAPDKDFCLVSDGLYNANVQGVIHLMPKARAEALVEKIRREGEEKARVRREAEALKRLEEARAEQAESARLALCKETILTILEGQSDTSWGRYKAGLLPKSELQGILFKAVLGSEKELKHMGLRTVFDVFGSRDYVTRETKSVSVSAPLWLAAQALEQDLAAARKKYPGFNITSKFRSAFFPSDRTTATVLEVVVDAGEVVLDRDFAAKDPL